MKFLLDMPMPQRTAAWLRAQGHDAVHARDLGLAQSSDEAILERARQEGRTVVTMDLDFPRLLLKLLPITRVGVILIRLRHPRPPAIQERLEALFRMTPKTDLSRVIAVLEETQIRIHRPTF